MVSSDPSLAQALQRAAEALRNGDNAAASQSLNDAAQQAAAANQQLADNAANEQTLSQLQERREQVAQAGRRQQAQPGQQAQQGQQGQGQGQGQNQGQGQGQGQGQNQGQGQGQGQNQGQGQGQNQGQGTGGSNADNLGDGTSGNSGNVGGNGPGQDFTDGRERGDTVYQPYRPAAQNGEQSQVGGQQGQQGSEQVRPGQFGPGAANGSQVPYEDVYGDYSNAANEALDRSAIPPHLKGYVRDYFSELEPE